MIFASSQGAAGQIADEDVLSVVRRWHDDNHPDPWPFCRHELCVQLRPVFSEARGEA